MRKRRIFVSYTLRDGEVTTSLLKSLKRSLSNCRGLDSYIDILDNHAIDHQNYVIRKLEEADVVLLIRSVEINASDWVNTELNIAQKRLIPILTVPVCDIIAFINQEYSDMEKNASLLQLLEFQTME